MQLTEAIQHAIEMSKEAQAVGSLKCSCEHMQLAAWLTELKLLRESVPKPYIQLGRHTQVKNEAGEWVDTPFALLKAGSVFRLFNLDGSMDKEGGNYGEIEEWKSQGVPFLTETGEEGVFTLGVMCKPANLGPLENPPLTEKQVYNPFGGHLTLAAKDSVSPDPEPDRRVLGGWCEEPNGPCKSRHCILDECRFFKKLVNE